MRRLGLRLVEEVRGDTGQIVSTRSVAAEDKLRAQQQVQTEIQGVPSHPAS